MPIYVEIVSQDRTVFEGDAEMVILPGVEGEMGVLQGHAPLLTSLTYGIITVRTKEDHIFTVAGGFVEVQPQLITILADAAEDVNDINLKRAEDAKSRAEELLKTVSIHDTDDYLAIEAALRRSNLRIDAVRRFRREKAGSQSIDN